MDNDLKRFKYACALVRSDDQMDKRESILHLEHLINHSKSYMKDALFQLATVYFVLDDFEAALNCAEELCRIDPDNAQVILTIFSLKCHHLT